VYSLYLSDSKLVPFYTDIMGKHQWLANGNLLVTDSKNGRTFELNEKQEIIWEFINLRGDGRVGIVQEVQRILANMTDIFDNAVCLQN
jgi:hypothetical protein